LRPELLLSSVVLSAEALSAAPAAVGATGQAALIVLTAASLQRAGGLLLLLV
jgi:hypothetical protein